LKLDTIIHIGFIKTGSTWLQKQFFPFVKNATYCDRKFIYYKFIKPDNREFDQKSFLNEISEISTGRTIISHESITGGIYMRPDKRIELAHRLKSVFPEGRIMIFIRNQSDIIASVYSMHTLVGETRTVTNFMFNKKLAKKTGIESTFVFDFLKFDRIISLYQELFGKDKVDVFLYEDFAENNFRFLDELIKGYGLEIDSKSLNFKGENPRLRMNIQKILRITNHFSKHDIKLEGKPYFVNIPGWEFISLRIAKSLDNLKVFGHRPSDIEILGEENYKFINDYFRESNNKLFNELGIKEKNGKKI